MPGEAYQRLVAQVQGAAGGSPCVLVCLSSVLWREAWKYGDRSFRWE